MAKLMVAHYQFILPMWSHIISSHTQNGRTFSVHNWSEECAVMVGCIGVVIGIILGGLEHGLAVINVMHESI